MGAAVSTLARYPGRPRRSNSPASLTPLPGNLHRLLHSARSVLDVPEFVGNGRGDTLFQSPCQPFLQFRSQLRRKGSELESEVRLFAPAHRRLGLELGFAAW